MPNLSMYVSFVAGTAGVVSVACDGGAALGGSGCSTGSHVFLGPSFVGFSFRVWTFLCQGMMPQVRP